MTAHGQGGTVPIEQGGPHFVTAGEVLAAFIAEPDLPLGSADRFRRTLAGAEFNTAVGMARLGVQVGFAGRVGDDALGAAVEARLQAEGVAATITVDRISPTGLLVRDCGPSAPVEVVYGRHGSAGSRLGAADFPVEEWGQARMVLVTGITAVLSESSAGAVDELVELAGRLGATLVIDPNVRRRLAAEGVFSAALAPHLGAAGIVLAGEDELAVLTGEADAEMAARALLNTGVGLVVGKRGAGGSWATDGRSIWRGDVRAVNAVDTVGAGDAFAAGFLSSVLDGQDVPAALARGARVAERVVRVWGDIEGLPTSAAMMTGAEMLR